MASEFPTGTVTFLFTDIEGSTKLAQEHRTTWENLRARHHAILRAAMQAHNGYVFQIIGDAFCVAFHASSDGLNASLEAQRKLQAEKWGDTPVRVRMGIHTGEAQPHAGDYRGYLTLARVQRVMSAAHGGQILLSSASAELLRGELPPEVSLRHMGEHRLKSLLNPEHLWQAVTADLQQVFPALESLNGVPNNLPVQLTSFVGREKEIPEVSEVLGRTRQVTLTGVGGTGKTRLALQVAADVLDQFKDGVWLTELASVADPDLVPQTIAAALGVREQPGRLFLDILKDYLGHKNLLLLLDNCEHLIEACARAADALLHAAPHLKILATSREALGIAGEATFPVRSLSLPAPTAAPDAILQCDAVRLFIDRAVAVQPDFQVTAQNAPALAQVCARLDGIPLAVELAAARVKGLSVEQIGLRLDDRFGLLTGGSRTALPRHRTLRAAIDWSYKLLSEDEQALLRRLSVFAGGWTLEAAESVCAGEPIASQQVLDLQMRLIDKSLVVAETQTSEPRYHILETIRQYGQDKLNEAGEASHARTRHLAFFLDLAGRAVPEYRGRDAPLWFHRIDKERDNLRAAFEYAINSANADPALQLSAATWWMWNVLGPWSEGQRWAEAALAKTSGEHTAAEAATLAALGFFVFHRTDYSAAHDLWERSLAIWRQLGHKWWYAFVMGFLAQGAQNSTDAASASELFGKSLQLAREVNEPWLLAACLKNSGDNELRKGNLPQARTHLEESLQLIRGVGDHLIGDEVLQALGEIAEVERDYPRAARLYEESLAFCRRLGDAVFTGEVKINLGRVLHITGDIDRAAQIFTEVLKDSLQRGKKITILSALAGLGAVAGTRGDAPRAVRLVEASQTLFDNLMTGVYTSPHEAAWLERYQARAESELGQEASNSLKAEGRAMTLEEAVALALK